MNRQIQHQMIKIMDEVKVEVWQEFLQSRQQGANYVWEWPETVFFELLKSLRPGKAVTEVVFCPNRFGTDWRRGGRRVDGAVQYLNTLSRTQFCFFLRIVHRISQQFCLRFQCDPLVDGYPIRFHLG